MKTPKNEKRYLLMSKIASVRGRIDGLIDGINWTDRDRLSKCLKRISSELDEIQDLEGEVNENIENI